MSQINNHNIIWTEDLFTGGLKKPSPFCPDHLKSTEGKKLAASIPIDAQVSQAAV